MSRKLVQEVRRSGGELGKNDVAEAAVEAVFQAVDKLTGSGERVTVRGFGTFQVKHRNQRLARNPRTGEPITIAARDQLVFKAAK
jgi:DNA-binding protein HU-beta